MVISREGRPAIHRQQTVSALRSQFGADVLKMQIKERVAVSESAERHCSIFEHGDRVAAAEFGIVCKEILERI
jgi:chromosome partitioning protein